MAYTQPDDTNATPRRTQILGSMGDLSIDDYLMLVDVVHNAERDARRDGEEEYAAELEHLGERIYCTYEHDVLTIDGHVIIGTNAETPHGGNIHVLECVECGTVHAHEKSFYGEPCE